MGSSERLPLSDIRVVDFTHAIAGPYGVQLLALFGAEVIKVESSRHPDLFRRAGYGVSAPGPNASRNFAEFNRNKRDITVNMRNPEGPALLKRLVAVSDVVIENYSLGVMQRWGLDYKDLAKINPAVIMVSMQGMGRSGPHRDWVTWGPSLMPYSGLTWLWGHPDQEEPVGSQIAHPDYIVSTQGAIAVLAALEHRRNTGNGQLVELAQVAGTASLLPTTYLEYFVNHRIGTRQGNQSPWYAPYGCYRCAGEDRWLVIAVTSEAQWQRFCDVLGRPDWTRDDRLKDMPGRVRHRDTLDALVSDWTRTQDCHAAMERLQAARVPAGAVQNGKDLNEDPHLQARGMLMEQHHPVVPAINYPGIPVRLSRTPARLVRHAPLLGQDNDYVFQDLLGMPSRQVEDLMQREVLV